TLRSARVATLVSANKSSALNPKAARDVPPIGKCGRYKNESPQKFRRRKAGRDQTQRPWHRPRRKIFRQHRFEKPSRQVWPPWVYLPPVLLFRVIWVRRAPSPQH